MCGGASPRHKAAGFPGGEGGHPSGFPVQQGIVPGPGPSSAISWLCVLDQPWGLSELGLLVCKAGTIRPAMSEGLVRLSVQLPAQAKCPAEGVSPPSPYRHPPQPHGHHPLPQQGPKGAGVVKAGAGGHLSTLPPCTVVPCSSKILPWAHLSLGQTQCLELSTPTERVALMSAERGESGTA